MPGTEIDKLFNVVYEELRQLANAVRRGDPSATLNPTALVHEAWLKLASSPQLYVGSALHFKRIAARAMRQVLVEAARHRNADKRGGGAALAQFDESLAHGSSSSGEIMALDEALRELETLDPRRETGVEARFFGGCTAAEIATLLGVSEETVFADWRGSKAWLANRLREK